MDDSRKYLQQFVLKFTCLIFVISVGIACQFSPLEQTGSQSILIPITSPLDTPQPIVTITKTLVLTATRLVTNTDMETMLVCEQKFQDVITKREVIRHESEIPDLVQSFVEAGEYYLNHCIDQQMRLIYQEDKLEKLRTLAKIIPATESCGLRYEPTIQLFDLDTNGLTELMLNSQLVRCDINYEHRGVKVGSGGINVIYYFDTTVEQWQGYILWPCNEADCLVHFGMQSLADIQVFPPQEDNPEYPLIFLSASFPGGDSNTEELYVGRWQNNTFETIFSWSHNNWCRPFPAWEITLEEDIFVPGVETWRPDACPEGTRDALYVYQNGKFVDKLAEK